jgi:putative hydrolase of the HAD superfamily
MHPSSTCRRVLLIDAMGTLVSLEPPAPVLRAELARRFGVDVSAVEAEHAIAAEIRYYRANLDSGRDPATVDALRRECAEQIRAALGNRLAGVGGAALTDALVASLRFSVYADAPPFLRAVRRRGQAVIVVSNWDASLPQVIERVGLAPLVDDVIASAAVGARKPEPAIFRCALERCGADPACAVHVGDSLEEDVAGARAAGIAAVWLNRGGRTGAEAPLGVRTVSALSEVDPYP